MSRGLKVAAGVMVLAVVTIFFLGLRDEVRAQSMSPVSGSAARPIFPEGGSDGPS